MLHDHLVPRLRPRAKSENIVTRGGLRITVLADRLFRIETSPDGVFTDEASQLAWYRDMPATVFKLRETKNGLELDTGAVRLILEPERPREGRVIFPDGSSAALDNGGNLLGTFRTLDTNGEHLRILPQVNRYDKEHIPLSAGVCSLSGVAVLDDSSSLLLCGDGRLMPRRSGTEDFYVFAYGYDYPAAVRALYDISGYPPAVPRWALGNWWSRYWPYTQDEYLELMERFDDEGIPISVAVIDMDWHYVDIEGEFGSREKGLDGEEYGGTDGWTGYTWNEKLYPDHVALLKELHRQGRRTSLNLHPALGVRWYEKPYADMALSLGLDPETKLHIPFAIQDADFVNSYLDILHHPLEDEGVDFWWVDWQQGDKIGRDDLDPLWALNHYHWLDSEHRTGEGLILSRYCGPGAQRYPVGFSGDTHMDWEFLRYMPYFTATASNVGFGWWSHDIGGHHRGERDDELYLRWLQFGVFSPINRIHCCPAPTVSKEPWTLSSGAREIAAKWFRLRHMLIPYIYTYACLGEREGGQLISPMYHFYPDKPEAYAADGQYMFGEDILVAPITAHSESLGMGETDVWLPEGRWTDIFTGLVYDGGRRLHMLRDMGSIPALAKAGTVLTLDAEPDSRCTEPEKLLVRVFPGNGAFQLFEGSPKEPYVTVFTQSMEEEGRLSLEISMPPGKWDAGRSFELRFEGIFSGELIMQVCGERRPVRTRRCGGLRAEFTLHSGENAALELHWMPETPRARFERELLQLLIRLPQDNMYKEKEWERLKTMTKTEIGRYVQNLDFPTAGIKMLEELLLAETT